MINPIIPNELLQLIQKVRENKAFSESLQVYKEKYIISGTNVNFLTPQKVLQTYSIIKKKFYYERKNPANCSWFENQLRIFIWVLLCYLYVNKKDLLEMTQEDWSFFKPIFYNREPILFEFQGILLIKDRNSKWQEQQIKLLDKIVKIKSLKNKWNSIARQLYITSDKKFVKTPKQCRERWLNYLDPSKVHSPWTNQEDLALLTSIRDYGKRWAYTVKKLLKKRTEHMVKNRFNSLINNEKKRIGSKNQQELLIYAIQTAKRSLSEENKHKNIQNARVSKIITEEISLQKKEIQNFKLVQKTSKGQPKPRKTFKQKDQQRQKQISKFCSMPTLSYIQLQKKEPAENNQCRIQEEINKKKLSQENIKCKMQEELNPLQFFQQSQSVIEFNPFQECTPLNQKLLPSFFLQHDGSESSQSHQRKQSYEIDQKNYANIYFFN